MAAIQKRDSDADASTDLEKRPDSVLHTTEGRTVIADVVVEKIAALAAREVRGVHKLGTGSARALGAVRERIPGTRPSLGAGVSVEVGERQAAVDLDLVIEYDVEIAEVSASVRRNVIEHIGRMAGLDVTEVNINVFDVYIPGDDDGPTDPRVQ